MNLTLWNKRNAVNGDLARLRDEMGRTFERFFTEPFGFMEPKNLRTEGWIPPLDVSETETDVTIRAEVPGIGAKDLDISVSGNTLTIAGEKEQQEEKKGEDFYRCERSFGSFRRVIELPDTVDPDKVAAESDNGVVTIRVAKKPGAKPRQVEIRPVASTAKRVPVAG
jgi:HSP20 family protein